MGGKRNQAHRTKGNARPSSSGRTAEKLAISGNILPNFMGFGGFAVDPIQGSDDHADVNINADLRLAMKKMTKKDVTTKLKAIQEFTDSCQSRPPEEIKAMLSFWPRLFNKLSMDHDRRIREALFQAHEQVVIRAHKNLAPFLRNIMGSWIIAQCDSYAPAACAAQKSFKAAFPPAKQPEAVAFCKTEIIGLIEDNLFHQTARTLTDPETTPVEEMEAKYIRIISCSFLAWKLILNIMPKTEHEALMDNYSKMLSEAKFWKFAKHESPLIRSAWFSLISTLCQVVPSILNEKKLCPIVLSSLDDSDALVSPMVWEAAMYTLVTFDDCWNHVNARKAVLPKLWSVLERGGNGNASIIYPNLLPFLNKVPAKVMGNSMEFYVEFFTRMRTGLCSPQIQSSLSEIASVVKAYMECLKFIASKHMDDDDLKIERLIADQLLPVLKLSTTEASSKLKSTNFYELFTDLLQHWNNNASELHIFLLQQFENMCKDILALQTKKDINRLAEVFECLLGKMRPRKPLHVQFTDAIDNEDDKLPLEIILPKYFSDEQHPFYHVLCNVCLFALQLSRNSEIQDAYLEFLASIASCYSSSNFLLYLTEKKGHNLTKAGLEFFNEVVLPWLLKDSFSLSPLNLIDLALAAYRCVDEESKLEILNKLCQAKIPEIIEQLLHKAQFYRDDKLFMDWLKSETLESRLEELTLQLCSESSFRPSKNTDSVWRILSFSFSSNENFEPLVSSSSLGKILNIFQQALSRESLHLEPSLQFVCNLASKLFVNFKQCWSITSTTELLVTMFSISCQPPRNLSGEILNQVESTWLLGIRSFSSSDNGLNPDGFFHQASKLIHNAISSENLTMKCLDNLVTVTWKLLVCLHQQFTENENSTAEQRIQEVFDLFLPSTSTWQRLRKQLGNSWMLSTVLEDALVFTQAEVPEQSTENLAFISMASFVAQILIKKCCNEEEKLRSVSYIITDHLKEILYAITYCEMIENGKRKKQMNEIVSYMSTEVKKQIPTIIFTIESKDSQKMIEELEDFSKKEGNLWSLCYSKTVDIVPKLHTKELKQFNWHGQNEAPFFFHSAFVTQKFYNTDWESNPLNTVNSDTNVEISNLIEWIAISRKQLEFSNVENTNAQLFVKTVLELFISWRDEKSEYMLFARDIRSEDWLTIIFNVEIFKFISIAISKFGESLDLKHWDFILCGLCLWIESCSESEKSIFGKLSVLLYVCECCNFFKVASDFITNVNDEILLRNHPKLVTEWNEFFSDSQYSTFLRLLISVSGMKGNAKLTYTENKFILALTLALEKIPVKSLENNHLKKLNIEGDLQIPEDIKTLIAHLSPLMSSSIRSIQISAYRILKHVIPIIAKCCENQELTDDITENLRQLPISLKTLLTDMTAVVNSYFAEVGTIVEPVNIQPDSSIFSYMMSYLLAWDLVMELLSSVSSELRSEYSEYLHTSGLIPDLLANLFYLIPENATLPNQHSGESSSPQTMFSVKLSLNLKDKASAFELQHIACQVYFEAIKKLPALVRQWWNNQDKQMLTLVEKITSKYVSTILLTEELHAVQNSGKNFGNMSVRARVKTQEFVAVYTIDEVSIELVIKLAPNHPLGRVSVECVRRIGVGHSQWRNWMLQLNTFLMYQNGSILDGLSLWKRNIDKKFEGIEECYICFYVLHGSNCQLPRLVCRTCKKKFHSACLYKWFSTSNQSTCPLCRNLFY